MKLIIGLGNPGKEFVNTRHNAGFLVLDAFLLTSDLQTSFNKKFNTEVVQQKKATGDILYGKPQTFMNNSGSAIRALVDFYKLKPTDLIVIHDEKDIPLGEFKIQTNRGAAGHNGVQSIIDHLGTKDFTRIRVGVGPTEGPIERIEEYVLEKFSKAERKKLDEVTIKIIEELQRLLSN